MTPLRLDDIGASSKRYERHRGKWWRYDELTPLHIDRLGLWLRDRGHTMTLAITACWVEGDGSLTPFHSKYHDLAGAIHFWVRQGIFEIAAHGLTHCVPGRHVPSVFMPWRGNRQWHREFIDCVPMATQREHMTKAKALLEHRFMVHVTTLVPPGNAISEQATLWALEHGYDRVVCRARGRRFITDDAKHAVIHDAEIAALGVLGVMDKLPRREYRALGPVEVTA